VVDNFGLCYLKFLTAKHYHDKNYWFLPMKSYYNKILGFWTARIYKVWLQTCYKRENIARVLKWRLLQGVCIRWTKHKMAFNRPLSSVKIKMTRNTRYSLTKELGKRYIFSNLPIIISSQFSDCLFFYYYKNFHICVSLSSLQKTLQCSYTSFSQFIVSSSNKSLCL
jgi:hypothetical protein